MITKREIVMRTVSDMQKTILMDSDSIIRKFMSGLVQGIALEKRLISIICKYPGKIMEFSKFHLNSK